MLDRIKFEMSIIELTNKNLLEIEKKIDSCIETRNERMMEIPGIGSILCATILAEVGDIKRFSSFNKFYAYTGLEPRRFETDDSVSRDKVSHEGSRHLRVVFYKNMQY